MLIDCATCIAPQDACRDCVVTVLLDLPAATGRAPKTPGTTVEFDDAEQGALAELCAAGLVPPLRLVAGGEPDAEAPQRQVRGIA